MGKHILKVEPLNAILDPHYFVRAVHECVMAWLKSVPNPITRQADQREQRYKFVWNSPHSLILGTLPALGLNSNGQ